MIIECPNCNKKFKVKSELVPTEGRNMQCGSCNHIWFFTKEQEKLLETSIDNDKKINKDTYSKKQKPKLDKISKNKDENLDTKNKKKNSALVKYEKSTGFTLTKFLSYILVILISIVAVIIIIDTFKSPLFKIFPNLELLLFNIYETIKDIILFIKDLG